MRATAPPTAATSAAAAATAAPTAATILLRRQREGTGLDNLGLDAVVRRTAFRSEGLLAAIMTLSRWRLVRLDWEWHHGCHFILCFGDGVSGSPARVGFCAGMKNSGRGPGRSDRDCGK